MSRSYRAWRENRAPRSIAVGGVENRAGLDRQARLESVLLSGAVSFLKCLGRLLVVSLLVVALVPASALAQSAGSRQDKAQGSHSKQPGASAGRVILGVGSGYFSRARAAQVRALQRRLASAGYAPGPIDGRYGPLTEQAVKRFQSARGLRVDGIAGPITLATLGRSSAVLYPGAGYEGHGSKRVRALQRRLVSAGYAPGPIDGRYGPLTQQAVKRFQSARSLQVDGIAGPQTFVHLSVGHGPHKTTRPARTARPAPSRQPASEPAHAHHPRFQTTPAQTRRTPASRHVAPVSHPTSAPSLGLFAVLAALLAALGLLATWLAFHRRHRHPWGIDAPATTSRDYPNPMVTQPNPSITPNPERTSTPAAIPSREGIPHRRVAERALTREETDRVFRYAVLLEEHGDQMAAIAAYQRADQLGHGPAATNLGELYAQHGNMAAAEACYRRADQRGDADGAFNLALLLEDNGDLTGAMAAYQHADQLGHAAAATNLGLLIEQQGDPATAEVYYRRAGQRGDPNGAFNLALALEKDGDQLGALRAYERVDQLGQAPIADMARAAAQQLKSRGESPTGVGRGGGRNGS